MFANSIRQDKKTYKNNKNKRTVQRINNPINTL